MSLKSNLFIFLICFCFSVNAQCGCDIHVIIELGQSNAGARCGTDLNLIANNGDARIWNTRMFGDGSNGTYGEGVLLDLGTNTGYDNLASNYSIGSIVASERSKETCEMVMLFKLTHGGAPLHQNSGRLDWNVNSGELYQTFINEWNQFLSWAGSRNVIIDDVIWVQGEADTGAANASNYLANLTDLYGSVNSVTGFGGAWTFVRLNENNTVYDQNGIQAVNAAFDAIGGNIINTNNTTYCDGVHYDSQSIVDLANQIQ